MRFKLPESAAVSGLTPDSGASSIHVIALIYRQWSMLEEDQMAGRSGQT